MSSGDTLFILDALNSSPPSANFATRDQVSDASTPNIVFDVLDFDGTVDEHMDWHVTIPSHYSETTGFTFSYKFAMDGTDGDVVELEFRVLPLANLDVLTGDLGIDGQTPVTITDDPDVTANKFNESTTGTLAKAAFGSAGPNTRICIRATRDISVVANPNDLQLLEILVKET